MKVVFALFSILVGPVLGNMDEHLETVLAVSQCRASCLDQFSHVIRTEDNCEKDVNCLMCWETCRMLIKNYVLWSPMCEVPDVCLPGCQKACNFEQPRRNESFFLPPTLLRSVYEPHMDRVGLEWIPDKDLKSKGTVLYVVLLKDHNQSWYQVAQTTSHVVHIKRGLLNRNTIIRVLAANATSKLLDSETSYLESYITDSPFHTNKGRENKFWKPRLESMVQSELTVGLMTTITWPAQVYKSETTQYEVSWNVIDDSIEITGHLYTSSNAAILTLWPNSLYSVQVSSYTADKHLLGQSEPLIIDTTHSRKETGAPVICSTVPGEKLAINAFAFLSAFFLTFLILAFIWVFKRKRGHFVGDCEFEGKELPESTGKFQVKIQTENTEPQREIVMNQQDTKENISHIPTEIKSEIFHIV